MLGVKGSSMRVELALLDGDTLLGRREIVIGATQQIGSFPFYRASAKPGNEAAIVLDGNTLCEF
jgi:hypothetical protein